MGALLGGAGTLTGGFSFANGYALDSVPGANWVTAWGGAALTASWKNGNLFDLASPAVTIKGIGPGYPDIASLAAAMGIDPRNGVGFARVSKFYHHAGGNDWTPTGVYVWLIYGKLYFTCGGILNAIAGLAESSITSAAAINNRSFTVFAGIIPYTSLNIGSSGTVAYQTVFGTRAGTPGATDIGLLGPSIATTGGTLAPKIYSGAADYTSGIQQTLSPYIGIQPQILSLVGTATATRLQVNNTTAAGSALVANAASTPLSFGQSADGVSPFSGRMTFCAVSPDQFTPTQVNSMNAAFAAWNPIFNLSVNKANAANIVVAGASRDISQGSTLGVYKTTDGGGYGYCEMIKDGFALQGKQFSWHNVSTSGAKLSDLTTLFNGFAQASVFQSGSAKNILIAPGISGIATIEAGATGANAYNNDYKAFLAAARTGVAWDRIGVIAHPDAGNGEVLAYNNLVVANRVADGVDILDERGFNLFAPPLSQIDGHPAFAGTLVDVSVIQPWLAAQL